MLVNNIFYNEFKMYNTGRMYWKCKYYKAKRCPSRILMGPNIISPTDHNHHVAEENITTTENDHIIESPTEEMNFARQEDFLN